MSYLVAVGCYQWSPVAEPQRKYKWIILNGFPPWERNTQTQPRSHEVTLSTASSSHPESASNAESEIMAPKRNLESCKGSAMLVCLGFLSSEAERSGVDLVSLLVCCHGYNMLVLV